VDYSTLDRAVFDDRRRGFLMLIMNRRRRLILSARGRREPVEWVQSVTTALYPASALAHSREREVRVPTTTAR
jgi:hypothetical protein